jgi:hypothetical protein
MIGALFITSFQLGLTSWADGQGEPSKEAPPRFRFAVVLIYIGVALSVTVSLWLHFGVDVTTLRHSTLQRFAMTDFFRQRHHTVSRRHRIMRPCMPDACVTNHYIRVTAARHAWRRPPDEDLFSIRRSTSAEISVIVSTAPLVV